MTTFEILGVAVVFLLIGYLMGRCGGRQVPSVPQYPKSFTEKLLGPSKPDKPMPPYEDDPYAEAMADEPESKGTIEDG